MAQQSVFLPLQHSQDGVVFRELRRWKTPRVHALDHLDLVSPATSVREQEGAVFQEHLLYHRADEGLRDEVRVQDARHGLADVLDGLAVVILLAIKDPIHEALEPFVNGFEEKNHHQGEADGEQRRAGDVGPTEGEIQERNHRGIGGHDGAGGQHVPVRPPDDDVDGEEIVLHDGIADGQRE